MTYKRRVEPQKGNQITADFCHRSFGGCDAKVVQIIALKQRMGGVESPRDMEGGISQSPSRGVEEIQKSTLETLGAVAYEPKIIYAQNTFRSSLSIFKGAQKGQTYAAVSPPSKDRFLNGV